MTLTVEAVYAHGVLKPAQALPLKEHETVRITIEPRPAGLTARLECSSGPVTLKIAATSSRMTSSASGPARPSTRSAGRWYSGRELSGLPLHQRSQVRRGLYATGASNRTGRSVRLHFHGRPGGCCSRA